MWGLLCVSCLLTLGQAALPPGCQDVTSQPLDTTNPASIYGTNQELAAQASPTRTGNLRSRRPLPTHAFFTNVIKPHTVPLRLFPFEAVMEREGITYDAYTLDRWSDPKRTDIMDEQSAWEQGKPWNRLLHMGTNFKQMVSGPDGNPLGVFTGKSGVRLGMENSGDPELTDFGDLFGNFMYHAGAGSMEVPLVRGAMLATHVYRQANPLVKPMCLSSINGQHVRTDCPSEGSAASGGSGFLEGNCQGNTLTITLHNTREIHDVDHVQYAVEPSGNWGSRSMRNCDAQHCRSANGGKDIIITVPNSHGRMSFAINYIGHYVLPWDWGNHPETASCAGRRDLWDTEDEDEQTEEVEVEEEEEGEEDAAGRMTRGVEEMSLSARCSGGQAEIRVDLGSNNVPGVDKVQYAVNSVGQWASNHPMITCNAAHCSRQGTEVVIRVPSPGDPFRVAANIISWTVLPAGDWEHQALTVHCNGQTVGHQGGGTQTQAPHTSGTQRPPGGGTATHHVNADTKFLLELDEPMGAVPNQVRKFVLYFSNPVDARVEESTGLVHFSPKSGGLYSGLVQLGYLGTGRRGDNSGNNFLDKYAGTYSYKPQLTMCTQDNSGKSYMNFDWHPTDATGRGSGSPLLMVAMPHHELMLRDFAQNLKDTPFGFKAYEGDHWLMTMTAPRAAMEPEPAALNRVKANPSQSKDIRDAIERDSHDVNLDAICAHSDSYNVGKAIGMAARLASLSRAMDTNHHNSLDQSIRHCLDRWLRVDDSLEDLWKFHYDQVWGGLFLRATTGNLDFGTDYGFPYYNDHHFHLGYFIYAMAYLARVDHQWAQRNRQRLLMVARDVGNPSWRDPHFPVARHKDMYTGFSWASGLVPGERQEESASESINCYHGLAALGDALGDDHLRHTGQVLLALELASVREYWQVRQHNRQHFPPMFIETGVAGQIAEDAWYVYTLDWPCDPNRFPMRHGCLVGIQVIPITAVSKYWVDHEWAGSIRQSCEWAINPHLSPDYAKADPSLMKELGVGWKAFCHAALAPLDSAHQTAAANYLKTKSARELVGGTGAASTLLFIYGST